MADEKGGRRRFDFGLGGMPPAGGEINSNLTGVLGQMFGGIGAGLGQGFAAKLNERVLLTAAALAGRLANPTHHEEIERTAAEAITHADAALKLMDENPDPRFHDPENAPHIAIARSPELTDYHDAVQRLTESCDSYAERLSPGEKQFFKARIEAVREAGKKLR